MRSNCIAFAIRLRARRRAKGKLGYITVRPSLWRPLIWHWIYTEIREDGHVRMIALVPRRPVRSWLPPVIFDGMVENMDRAARLEFAKRQLKRSGAGR